MRDTDRCTGYRIQFRGGRSRERKEKDKNARRTQANKRKHKHTAKAPSSTSLKQHTYIHRAILQGMVVGSGSWVLGSWQEVHFGCLFPSPIPAYCLPSKLSSFLWLVLILSFVRDQSKELDAFRQNNALVKDFHLRPTFGHLAETPPPTDPLLPVSLSVFFLPAAGALSRAEQQLDK